MVGGGGGGGRCYSHTGHGMWLVVVVVVVVVIATPAMECRIDLEQCGTVQRLYRTFVSCVEQYFVANNISWL